MKWRKTNLNLRFSHGSRHLIIAVFSSVALHALVLGFATNYRFNVKPKVPPPKPVENVVVLTTVAPPPRPSHLSQPAANRARSIAEQKPVAHKSLASMAAPAAPTAEDWAFASQYPLKNSKGYRYNWGQQVRSMMGTAVEGPDQGVVRFRVEIAPDGSLATLETLWTTSAHAEKLARKAIQNMPPLPPTPTGKPLIFEKTISFSPYASDSPPVYKDDCLPDPPVFRNPFAWDGKSPQLRAAPKPAEKPDPQTLAECLKQLPRDTIEAESAQDQRLLDQWGSIKSGR